MKLYADRGIFRLWLGTTLLVLIFKAEYAEVC